MGYSLGLVKSPTDPITSSCPGHPSDPQVGMVPVAMAAYWKGAPIAAEIFQENVMQIFFAKAGLEVGFLGVYL